MICFVEFGDSPACVAENDELDGKTAYIEVSI